MLSHEGIYTESTLSDKEEKALPTSRLSTQFQHPHKTIKMPMKVSIASTSLSLCYSNNIESNLHSDQPATTSSNPPRAPRSLEARSPQVPLSTRNARYVLISSSPAFELFLALLTRRLFVFAGNPPPRDDRPDPLQPQRTIQSSRTRRRQGEWRVEDQ